MDRCFWQIQYIGQHSKTNELLQILANSGWLSKNLFWNQISDEIRGIPCFPYNVPHVDLLDVCLLATNLGLWHFKRIKMLLWNILEIPLIKQILRAPTYSMSLNPLFQQICISGYISISERDFQIPFAAATEYRGHIWNWESGIDTFLRHPSSHQEKLKWKVDRSTYTRLFSKNRTAGS